MFVPISIGIASTSVSIAMFEPIALPNGRIGFFSSADVIPTTVSGKDVEMAIRRKVTVYPDRLKNLAIFVEELINNAVLFIRRYELMKITTKYSKEGITIYYTVKETFQTLL
ncbi:MAG: hypothetical protein A2106_01290 [Planctomycetes bacterium GWF2_40_8]|nr:MAG: hypothetical protein A2106_01290 [Planctomycetes bacterium GWF2_40_8]